jgi:hypothetical protein
MGAEKAIPSMARQTIKVPIFFATAQGMTKMTATRRVVALDIQVSIPCITRL